MLKRVVLILGIVLLLTTPLIAQPSAAIGMQPGQVVTPWSAFPLTAPITSQSYSIAYGSVGAPVISWQVSTPSAPTSFTANLQASNDGTTYATVDSATAAGIRTVYGSYKFIRFTVSAVSGGSSPTITISVVYSTTASASISTYSGGTVTTPILLPDGTAAAPSLAFASEPGLNTGFYKPADSKIYMSIDGNATHQWETTAYSNLSDTGLFRLGVNKDVVLARDAANTLALRNSTNAQVFRNYYSYTDGSNNAYIEIATGASGYWGDTYFSVTGVGNGATAAKTMIIGNNGDRQLGFATNAARRWTMYESANTYNLAPNASDTSGIGFNTQLVTNVYLSRSIQGSKTKALTESSATAAWDCALAASAHTGGTLNYCVYAADATDFQERCASIRVAAVNKAGTTTCGISTVTGNTTVNETTDANAVALSTGTLTYAVTCADTTNSFSISFNAVSSLTQTTLQSESRWDIMTPATCTPQ